jgi:hypothetical protein
VLFLVAASAANAESPKLLNAGRWQITLQNESPHAAPPVTYIVCIDPGSAERPEPPKGKPSDTCKVTGGGVSGNVLSYATKCGAKRSSNVRITYHGDRYEGVVELIAPEGKLRQIITAKRVGACDDPPAEEQQ